LDSGDRDDQSETSFCSSCFPGYKLKSALPRHQNWGPYVSKKVFLL